MALAGCLAAAMPPRKAPRRPAGSPDLLPGVQNGVARAQQDTAGVGILDPAPLHKDLEGLKELLAVGAGARLRGEESLPLR